MRAVRLSIFVEPAELDQHGRLVVRQIGHGIGNRAQQLARIGKVADHPGEVRYRSGEPGDLGLVRLSSLRQSGDRRTQVGQFANTSIQRIAHSAKLANGMARCFALSRFQLGEIG